MSNVLDNHIFYKMVLQSQYQAQQQFLPKEVTFSGNPHLYKKEIE